MHNKNLFNRKRFIKFLLNSLFIFQLILFSGGCWARNTVLRQLQLMFAVCTLMCVLAR